MSCCWALMALSFVNILWILALTVLERSRTSRERGDNRQDAGLELADPDPDQLARDVVPLGQRVQRLARDELLSDLPLERGAV